MSDITFVPHSQSYLMRFLKAIGCGKLVKDRFVTLNTTVYYPDGQPPEKHPEVIEHETVHIQQYERLGIVFFLLLYFVFPLPFFFSGRWWLEREAYLVELRCGAQIDDIVDELWSGYLWPWPKFLMRKWFATYLSRSR